MKCSYEYKNPPWRNSWHLRGDDSYGSSSTWIGDCTSHAQYLLTFTTPSKVWSSMTVIAWYIEMHDKVLVKQRVHAIWANTLSLQDWPPCLTYVIHISAFKTFLLSPVVLACAICPNFPALLNPPSLRIALAFRWWSFQFLETSSLNLWPPEFVKSWHLHVYIVQSDLPNNVVHKCVFPTSCLSGKSPNKKDRNSSSRQANRRD